MSIPGPAALPGIPWRGEEPVFRAPWEAQAFAMAVLLHERGHFSWTEWATRLGDEIAAANTRSEPDDGTRYYYCWLAALEKLVAEKGIVATADLVLRREQWERAASTTPHGKPIVLPRQ